MLHNSLFCRPFEQKSISFNSISLSKITPKFGIDSVIKIGTVLDYVKDLKEFLEESNIPFMITHYPGHMLVTDWIAEELAVL